MNVQNMGITDDEIDILEPYLKKCPLCDQRAFFEESSGFWYVTCTKCGCNVPGNDPNDAMAIWNTRTPTREIPREYWAGW